MKLIYFHYRSTFLTNPTDEHLLAFCSDCGEKLIEGKKFCVGCGTEVNIIIQEINQETESSSFNQGSIFEEDDEEPIQKSSKELGNDLEDMIEQIMKIKGYTTETRIRIKGMSGQYNEIDVLAKQGDDVIAVECKNHIKQIGISDLRNFSAKLSDLEISNGLFVTASDFSRDAIGWANDNPQMTKIDLWNGDQIAEVFKKTILRRTGSNTVKIYDCLEPQDTIEGYSNILLKNKDKIQITKQELIFYPFYLTEFSLKEQFRTPDKQIHSLAKSGRYFVDGISKKILSRFDDQGRSDNRIKREETQIVSDLIEYDSYNYTDIQKITGNEIVEQLKPSMSKQDVEFSVRRDIVEENKANVGYTVRKSRDVVEQREFKFTPNINSIKVQSKVVYVPKLEIEFDSFGRVYRRTVLPASDIVLVDEIAFCDNRKHILGKKETYAVCEICGIAKCEDHILVDEENICFCKDHASEELRELNKGPSLKEKFGRFSFKKK